MFSNWPTEKPAVEPLDHGWLLPGTQRMLTKHLKPEMTLVLELGVWLGKSTRFILDQCPKAAVCAVDKWDTEVLSRWADRKHPHLSEVARRAYDTFLVNLWDERERVQPMRMDSIEAVRFLHARNIRPDLIYLDTSHAYPDTLHEIQAITKLFPDVPLVGDDWLYLDRKKRAAVRMSVEEFAKNNAGWRVESDENGWALLKVG